jgi:N-acetylmuramoyl-L-alanine amidase
MKKLILFAFMIFAVVFPVSSAKTVKLKNIRYYPYTDYTRVVLDLTGELGIKEKILPGKETSRMYFDLKGCILDKSFPPEKLHSIEVDDGNLKRIRLGKRQGGTYRVVFDFDHIGKYHRFYLTSPFRIVFDIFQDPNGDKQQKETILAPPSTTTTVPSTPPKSIDGKYSIARQLGLGVHRIIIDPGHGGKDPGTSNRKLKLHEKDLVLDICKRLKKLFEKQNNKYEVLMTRYTDVYISLEERTAIANSKKGDLFVSVHINSAPRKKARGIETYFLSMTTDPWAIKVAAQENAVSTKSIGEMKSILEQILKNAKNSESKALSGMIQQNLVKKLKMKYNDIYDLGVKKAPFYVLAGAQMPSVLAEVSFLSNYAEGKRLKTQQYRQRIAQGLFDGIMEYIKSLGKD